MLKFLYDGRLGEIFAPTKGAKDDLERAIHAGDLSACADLVQSQKFDIVGHINSQTGLNYLHTACQCGHREVAQLLLDAGSDVNAINAKDASTALHYAAKEGHTPVVEFLIERGAAGSLQDAKGKTPYDVASKASLRQFLLKFLYASQAQTAEQAAALLAAPPAQALQYSAENAINYGKCDGFGTSSHHDPTNPNYRGGQPWEAVSGPPPTGTNVAQTSVYAAAGTANVAAQSKYVAYVNPFTSGGGAPPLQPQASFGAEQPQGAPTPYGQPPMPNQPAWQPAQPSPFQHQYPQQPFTSPFQQQQPRTNPFQQPVTSPFQHAQQAQQPYGNQFQQNPYGSGAFQQQQQQQQPPPQPPLGDASQQVAQQPQPQLHQQQPPGDYSQQQAQPAPPQPFYGGAQAAFAAPAAAPSDDSQSAAAVLFS